MSEFYAFFMTLVTLSSGGIIETKIINVESQALCHTVVNMVYNDYSPLNPNKENSVRVDDNGNRLLLIECRSAPAVKVLKI